MSEQAKSDDNTAQASIADDLLKIRQVIEAALLAGAQPLSINQLAALFADDGEIEHGRLREALALLDEDCAERGIELKEVASGYRLQVRESLQTWISRLWEQKPKRYSRALLETLALIAYRQPLTRAEIEDVRGVSVSTHIIRTLEEREWIRVVGHRDVPGKPALFGTTRAFLDYFNLKSLDELPSLAEIREINDPEPELELVAANQTGTNAGAADDSAAGDEEGAREEITGEIAAATGPIEETVDDSESADPANAGDAEPDDAAGGDAAGDDDQARPGDAGDPDGLSDP